MEANPNHPVTQVMHNHWHAIALLLVVRLGGHTVITSEEIAAVEEGSASCIRELEDGIHLDVVDERTARIIATREGGLPA